MVQWTMVRFYHKLLRQIPKLLVDATGRWKTLFTIALFLVFIFNRQLAKNFISNLWTGISPWWSTLPVGLLLFYGIMRANFNEFLTLENRSAERDRRIGDLERRIAPSLDVIFDAVRFPSCIHEFPQPLTGLTFRLVRVGIINTSKTSIDQVVVRLENFTPQGATFLAIPLIMMHDRPPYDSSQSGLTIHPNGPLFVDVAQKRLTNDPTDQIFWQYAISGVPMNIQPGRYTLTLRAEGRDVPACRKQFVIDVDSNGGLMFSPAIIP